MHGSDIFANLILFIVKPNMIVLRNPVVAYRYSYSSPINYYRFSFFPCDLFYNSTCTMNMPSYSLLVIIGRPKEALRMQVLLVSISITCEHSSIFPCCFPRQIVNVFSGVLREKGLRWNLENIKDCRTRKMQNTYADF
jgi:hypothetical protein